MSIKRVGAVASVMIATLAIAVFFLGLPEGRPRNCHPDGILAEPRHPLAADPLFNEFVEEAVDAMEGQTGESIPYPCESGKLHIESLASQNDATQINRTTDVQVVGFKQLTIFYSDDNQDGRVRLEIAPQPLDSRSYLTEITGASLDPVLIGDQSATVTQPHAPPDALSLVWEDQGLYFRAMGVLGEGRGINFSMGELIQILESIE